MYCVEEHWCIVWKSYDAGCGRTSMRCAKDLWYIVWRDNELTYIQLKKLPASIKGKWLTHFNTILQYGKWFTTRPLCYNLLNTENPNKMCYQKHLHIYGNTSKYLNVWSMIGQVMTQKWKDFIWSEDQKRAFMYHWAGYKLRWWFVFTSHKGSLLLA